MRSIVFLIKFSTIKAIIFISSASTFSLLLLDEQCPLYSLQICQLILTYFSLLLHARKLTIFHPFGRRRAHDFACHITWSIRQICLQLMWWQAKATFTMNYGKTHKLRITIIDWAYRALGIQSENTCINLLHWIHLTPAIPYLHKVATQ